MTQLLTHSRLSTFRACPHKHWLRFELGLAPENDDVALRVGSGFHAALEAIDLGRDPEAVLIERGDLDPFDRALVAAMVQVHGEHWAGQALEVVATELKFDLPLVNPATGKSTPVWRIAGKIDRVYRLPDGRLAVQDYKTTTEDIAPGSDFWLRLSLDQQMSLYVLAARELGYDCETILYDVTKRPLQRPYRATPADKVKLRRDGEPYAGTRTRDETPVEFAARVADVMRAEPTKFFARHEIARLEEDLQEARAEVWQQQRGIREMQKSGRWYRSPGSCVTHYRCPYIAICGARDFSEVPVGFKRLDNVHPELEATDGGKPVHAAPGQAGMTETEA